MTSSANKTTDDEELVLCHSGIRSFKSTRKWHSDSKQKQPQQPPLHTQVVFQTLFPYF